MLVVFCQLNPVFKYFEWFDFMIQILVAIYLLFCYMTIITIIIVNDSTT